MALWQLNLSHAALEQTEQQRCKGFGVGHRQGHSRALNLIVHVCMSFFRRRDQKTDKVPRGKTIEVKSRTQRSRWILTPRGSNKTAKNVKKAARYSSHATLVVQPVFSLPGVLKGHEKLVAA